MQDLRRIKQAEVTPEMTAAARRILSQNRSKPLGTHIGFDANGRDWVAVIERHWDPERGPHPGVSLFEPIEPPVPSPHEPFFLGPKSIARLNGVDDRLVRVVKRAIEITTIDFTVVEGLRTKERQTELVLRGKSQTMNSRHLTGDAVDLAPWVDGAISWDWTDFRTLQPNIQAAANNLGITVQWGGNWPGFPDGPHWQLPWGS